MYIAVLKFNKTMESLLKKSCYIAGSQYRNLLQNACKAIEYFYVLLAPGENNQKVSGRNRHFQSNKNSQL